MIEEGLKRFIRNIPDFPKKGIVFRDITTLIRDKEKFREVIDLLAQPFKEKKIDYVVSVESRGFIFGGPLAYTLEAGLIPVRKRGKLPYETYSTTYSLEYGEDVLEIHKDAFAKGDNILIIDDLLATGGTTRAVIDLVKKMEGNVIACAFVIELEFLNGREKLKDIPVFSLVKYGKEDS